MKTDYNHISQNRDWILSFIHFGEQITVSDIAENDIKNDHDTMLLQEGASNGY